MENYKLADFLYKYDTVIFDMDGVITSEQHYWNCAALTVCQLMSDNPDAVYCMDNTAEIRADVFKNDRLISKLKNKGVNSNWDLGYVVYMLYIITDGDTEAMYEFIESFSNILDVYDDIALAAAERTGGEFEYFKRNSTLWTDMMHIFQEWFLGDELFERVYGRKPSLSGKPGFIHREEPIVSKKKVQALFRLMYENGMDICTGTGRPYREIYEPLCRWGIFDYLKKDGFINYDTVINAENELEKAGMPAALTKPHPFMFLKALYGENYPNMKIISGDYDKARLKKALVVGDAGADILAAKNGGFDFAAVLTGITGQKARGYFERMDADYIFDSVEDFLCERTDRE